MKPLYKHAAWMVICTVTMIVLLQFDMLATKELDSYGLIYRAVVWCLMVIMVVKGVLHGGQFFGNFDDLEFDIVEVKD